MIKVSILIPCHNAETWIVRCVDSALAQSQPGIEVLVIDDGSTDSSRELLRRFGGVIRLIEQDCQGANRARNRLLEEARGEWVQFLDADDELQRDKISCQLAGVTSVKADVLVGGVICEVWKNGSPCRREVLAVDHNSDLMNLWLAWKFPQTGGLLWRREALIGMGGWREELPCCQDYEVVMRAFQHRLAVMATACTGAVYRHWSEHTLSRKNIFQTLDMRTKLSFAMRDWLVVAGLYNARHKHTLGRSLFEMCRTLARYDLDVAEEYYRRHEGDVCETGPAAPRHYRLVKRVIGFRGAEKLAACLRHGF